MLRRIARYLVASLQLIKLCGTSHIFFAGMRTANAQDATVAIGIDRKRISAGS